MYFPANETHTPLVYVYKLMVGTAKITNFAVIENIKIARYFDVLESKYLHCYLILLFSLSVCHKVTRTMLTYHDSSGSFSHRDICNCNVVRNIDLKGPQVRPLSEPGTKFVSESPT